MGIGRHCLTDILFTLQFLVQFYLSGNSQIRKYPDWVANTDPIWRMCLVLLFLRVFVPGGNSQQCTVQEKLKLTVRENVWFSQLFSLLHFHWEAMTHLCRFLWTNSYLVHMCVLCEDAKVKTKGTNTSSQVPSQMLENFHAVHRTWVPIPRCQESLLWWILRTFQQDP